MSFTNIIECAVNDGASDVFIIPGQPVTYKTRKDFVKLEATAVTRDGAWELIEEIYANCHRDISNLLESGDDDFSTSLVNLARLRVSAYRQRGSFAAVIRIVSFGMPNYREIGIPENIMQVADTRKGLVIVAGASGNGKSTTLACMIDRINRTRSGHVITLEDPIEFLYKNKKSIISQREISLDTKDYITALRASLRQAPDVILVGEMRDYETISVVMTAAETGHLIFSTLHTLGVINTIDRIIDIFPSTQQQQIRVQLASLLNAVISQQLLPAIDGSLVPVFEIVTVNNAVRNMIREGKIHQLESVIGSSPEMQSMDNSIFELCRKGVISKDTAIANAMRPDAMEKRIAGL